MLMKPKNMWSKKTLADMMETWKSCLGCRSMFHAWFGCELEMRSAGRKYKIYPQQLFLIHKTYKHNQPLVNWCLVGS